MNCTNSIFRIDFFARCQIVFDRPTLFRSRLGEAIGRRCLCTVGEDKKIFRALHARACIEISLVPLVSSAQWVLEYPLGRGYEYAGVFYAILTRTPRFSMFSSRSTMKLYVRGRVPLQEEKRERRGETL